MDGRIVNPVARVQLPVETGRGTFSVLPSQYLYGLVSYCIAFFLFFLNTYKDRCARQRSPAHLSTRECPTVGAMGMKTQIPNNSDRKTELMIVATANGRSMRPVLSQQFSRPVISAEGAGLSPDPSP